MAGDSDDDDDSSDPGSDSDADSNSEDWSEGGSGDDDDSTTRRLDDERDAAEAEKRANGSATRAAPLVGGSLIPFTPQWFDARRDGRARRVKGMQEEVARCRRRSSTLIETGAREDALAELLSDTTMGFTEFNAIKSRAAAEGEWRWKKPRHLMRTGGGGRGAAKIARALRLVKGRARGPLATSART